MTYYANGRLIEKQSRVQAEPWVWDALLPNWRSLEWARVEAHPELRRVSWTCNHAKTTHEDMPRSLAQRQRVLNAGQRMWGKQAIYKRGGNAT